jgi:hypothetical protein
VKRDDIVAKFGRLRAVLESSERAALAAYDEAVRCMVKQAEVEAEGVEVLAQQLSAQALASCDADVSVDLTSGEPLESLHVDLAVCDDTLMMLLRECWKVVASASSNKDKQALAVASKQAEILEEVWGTCRHVNWCTNNSGF